MIARGYYSVIILSLKPPLNGIYPKRRAANLFPAK